MDSAVNKLIPLSSSIPIGTSAAHASISVSAADFSANNANTYIGVSSNNLSELDCQIELSPTFNLQTGEAEYDKYGKDIKRKAVRYYINNLLLNGTCKNVILEYLIHKYKLTTATNEQVWIKLMSKGYEAIDQIMNQANLQLSLPDYNTVMVAAAGAGYESIVKYMLKLGATDYDQTMISAASGGHMSIVQLMLNLGADEYDKTLVAAARNGNIAIIKLMLQKSPEVRGRHIPPNYLNYAMGKAAYNGHLVVVKFLLNVGANDYARAIQKSIMGKQYRMLQFLSQFASKMEEYEMYAAIEVAALSGNIPIMQLLVNMPRYFPEQDWLDEGLLKAAERGHENMIHYMLSLGADDYYLAMGRAIVNGHIAIAYWMLQLLRETKKSIPIYQTQNYIYIYIATQRGNIVAVKFMLEFIKDFNIPIYDETIIQSIQSAAKSGNIAIIDLILRWAVESNVKLNTTSIINSLYNVYIGEEDRRKIRQLIRDYQQA